MKLALIMAGLNVLLSATYGVEGDYRRAIYWLAAAVITLSVTL